MVVDKRFRNAETAEDMRKAIEEGAHGGTPLVGGASPMGIGKKSGSPRLRKPHPRSSGPKRRG